MKANELMIGDYLRINRDRLCIKKDTIVEVRGIDANNTFNNLIGSASCRPLDDMQYEGGIWCDYLDPIPLTAEILLKNGFADISEHTLKGAETYRLSIEQNYYDYTITIKLRDWFRLTSFDDREYTLCQINWGFKYVHELQRALKLCGIEKEVIL